MNLDRRALGIGTIALAIVLFLSVNVFSTAVFRTAQLDLTEEGLFTLSPGTHEILQSIDEPITLRLYLSEQLRQADPTFARYATRVQELLEQYERIAGGRLILQLFNPEPFTQEEDRAVGFGLRGVPVNEVGDLVYFGLVGTNSTDDQDAIVFFSPEREPFLEYDLTRLVYNLANPEKKVLGLLTPLPLSADPAKQYQPWVIYQQMEQFFDVRTLDSKLREIPEDVDVLMVAQPGELPGDTLYAIDQYVMRGGRTLIFADPHFEGQPRANPMMPSPPSNHGLDKLFAGWGIEQPANQIVGDRLSALRVTAQVGSRNVVADYLPWLSLGPEHFAGDDVVTGQIALLNMMSAGSFDEVDGSSSGLAPLVTSSVESMRINAEKVRYAPNPIRLLEEFKSGGKKLVLAARLNGTLASAFVDGPPPTEAKQDGTEAKPAAQASDSDATDKAEEAPRAPHLAAAEGPTHVIVVGDVDMLTDQAWVRTQDFLGQRLSVPIASNASFVLNALDNLAGDSAVIGLRSRGLSVRPFELVDSIRREAELKFRSKEQELEAKLSDVEKKISDIQTDEEGGVILTAEQRDAIQEFRAEMVDIRGQLRDVQHALRKDIEALGAWLRVINIGAIPLLVGLIAIGLAIVRRVRFGRHVQAQSG